MTRFPSRSRILRYRRVEVINGEFAVRKSSGWRSARSVEEVLAGPLRLDQGQDAGLVSTRNGVVGEREGDSGGERALGNVDLDVGVLAGERRLDREPKPIQPALLNHLVTTPTSVLLPGLVRSISQSSSLAYTIINAVKVGPVPC